MQVDAGDYVMAIDKDNTSRAVELRSDAEAKIASQSVAKGHVLILHTQNDDLVNVSHAENLYEWANEPKELLIFERGDHNHYHGGEHQIIFQSSCEIS